MKNHQEPKLAIQSENVSTLIIQKMSMQQHYISQILNLQEELQERARGNHVECQQYSFPFLISSTIGMHTEKQHLYCKYLNDEIP